MARPSTDDVPTEDSPLLGAHHDQPHGNHHDDALHAHTPESNALPPATTHITPARRIVIISMVFALCIVLAICATLANTAMMQGLEDIICRRVHGPASEFPRNITTGRDGDDPCKDDAITGEIAMIMGWDGVFNLLPSLFLAVPFGAVADHYGRVPVIGLVLFGVVLQILTIMFVCECSLP